MASYAFWNNKGGVGKSFLCFVAASEYAKRHPEIDVYVLDLCPQANLSETLLGGQATGGRQLDKLMAKPGRPTIAGYLEARLSSPFNLLPDVLPYVVKPNGSNRRIPPNVYLVCGDNLLELLAEAIRQTSQLVLPGDAWARVMTRLQSVVLDLHAASLARGRSLGSSVHARRELSSRTRERGLASLRREHLRLLCVRQACVQ